MSRALLVAKLALGALLLPQARWARRRALRLPEAAGPRQGVAGEGETRLRLLVVGDSSAAGVGVADQAQALALPLAKELAARCQGAVAWQLVARTGINAHEALSLVKQTSIDPADVAVIVLGVNDVSSQTPAAGFVDALSRLLDALPARWAVFSGLPPMHLLTALPHPLRWYLGRYAAWLDAALREWCHSRGFGYCAIDWSTDPRLLAQDGYHPGAQLYPQWAARIAPIVLQGAPR